MALMIMGVDEDPTGPFSRRAVTKRIKSTVAELTVSRPDGANLRVSDAAFDVDILPDVLSAVTR
eukprot:4082300-Pyramimonas_sp.AAC.1